jgi:hypothetical protein
MPIVWFRHWDLYDLSSANRNGADINGFIQNNGQTLRQTCFEADGVGVASSSDSDAG